ncbi:MAG: hypothetical protein OHK0012_13340 [Synechococcales cyanobacterium]
MNAVHPMTESPLPLETYVAALTAAMERGQYRQGLHLVEQALGQYPTQGELLLWQAIFTEALGQTDVAISLAERLQRHPQSAIRRDARRLLGIWKAPQLRRPPEWLTSIPEFNAAESSPKPRTVAGVPRPQPPRSDPSPTPEPTPASSYAVIWIPLGVVVLACLLWTILVGT